MQIIKSETFFEGVLYDRLFLLESNTVTPINRLFDQYIVSYDQTKMEPSDYFPYEMAMKIVVKTIIALLKDFHFAEAMELISINKYMIHYMYFAIYGNTKESFMVKHKRLSRTMALLQSLYDAYFSAYCVFHSPTVVLEYESDWKIQNRTVFYPWCFEPHISVIQVDHVKEHAGLSLTLGDNYGDKAFLIGAYEKKGILNCEKIAFPFIHFILMDAFQFLNVFENRETRYYFERFSMMIKAVFGKYCKTFFFSEKIPFDQVESDDDYAFIFENQYLFKELSYCVRK